MNLFSFLCERECSSLESICMEHSCLINMLPADDGQPFRFSEDWMKDKNTWFEWTIMFLGGDACRIQPLLPFRSFKYSFSKVKCFFNVTPTEDGGRVCTAGSMWRVMVLLTHCQPGANQSINRSIVIWWAPKDRKSPRNTWINSFVPHRLTYRCPTTHTHTHLHNIFTCESLFWSRTSTLAWAQSSNHQILLPWEQDEWEACLFFPSFLLPDPLFSSSSSSYSSFSYPPSPNGIQPTLAAISSHSHCAITQLMDRPGSLWSPYIFKWGVMTSKKWTKEHLPDALFLYLGMLSSTCTGYIYFVWNFVYQNIYCTVANISLLALHCWHTDIHTHTYIHVYTQIFMFLSLRGLLST